MDNPPPQLILFQMLSRGLSSLEEELTEIAARDLIVAAINLLPDYQARPANHPAKILVKELAGAHREQEIEFQNAVDSLKIIWQDYQHRIERAKEGP